MATTDIYTVQGALTPNRFAVRYLGGDVDDFVQVDAAAVALKAWAKGSITAWVMMPDITGSYTIFCAGDDNVVEFLQFSIEAGLLTMRSTDNTTAQFVSQADAVHFTPHKWHHVAVTQAANGQGVIMYVDGQKIAHTNDTSTDLDSWGSELGGLDKGLIGAANKSGDGSITVEFKGFISDVKHWGHATSSDAALTAAEVLADYNGNTPQTTYLVNHWDFRDDYIDAGTGADNGTASGAILLVNSANEFTSRLGFMTGTPVVADKIQMTVNNNVGYALVIQAA